MVRLAFQCDNCMPEFISKLQHKNYEKGEYSDEKARTLAETIELIKSFPWDKERGSDVQLTGPSVTIRDEDINYLKVGLYFNGKFCLYYFDRDGHLYEYHTPDLQDACAVVTGFFDRQINLEKFDKHTFSIGSKAHFENGSFDYRVKPVNFYMRFFFSLLLIALLAGSGLLLTLPGGPLIFKILFTVIDFLFILFIIYSLYLQVKYYQRTKNMLLIISAGNPIFKFGTDDETTEYDKANISAINIYGRLSSKGTPILDVFEIAFTEGTAIKFPAMLIDPYVFLAKFDNINVTRFDTSAEIRKSRWDFARSGE